MYIYIYIHIHIYIYIYIYYDNMLLLVRVIGYSSSCAPGKSIPSLWRDRRPAIESLLPPEHDARHSIRTRKTPPSQTTNTQPLGMVPVRKIFRSDRAPQASWCCSPMKDERACKHACGLLFERSEANKQATVSNCSRFLRVFGRTPPRQTRKDRIRGRSLP